MKRTALFITLFALIAAMLSCCARAEGVGDTVIFGSYPQGANGEAAPIEWIVLDIDEDGYYVLLSVCGLDTRPYNANWENTTWENCALRAWLNGDFYTAAFTAGEREKIGTALLANSTDSGYGALEANDTEDSVYLLSLGEVEEYFVAAPESFGEARDALVCRPTEYAAANGALVYDHAEYEAGAGAGGDAETEDADGDESVGEAEAEGAEEGGGNAEYDGNGWWWLRSPGFSRYSVAYVSFDGSVSDFGRDAYNRGLIVRPVIRVRFE